MSKPSIQPEVKTAELTNIKPLDGVRAVAILLVLFWHYICNAITGHEIFRELTFWTWSGVDLFFVLSGFLIGRILIKGRGTKNYLKIFYARRFFRIFPAYYLILLIYTIFLLTGLASHFPWLTYAPYPFYSYLFYIQNFWMAHTSEFGPNWLGSTWSLAVEEQFYLILPVLILLVNPKNLPRILIAGIVAAPIFRGLIYPGLGSYVLLPARMDSLLIGVLIAYYHLNGTLKNKFKNKETMLFISLALCFVGLIICGKITGYPSCGQAVVHSILVVFYGLVMVIVLTVNKNNLFIRFLSNPVMSFIARISYMVYLSHEIIDGLLHQAILHSALPEIKNLNGALVTLLSVIATFSFSAVSYYTFERPLLNIGKKYKGEKIKGFSLIAGGAVVVYALILYLLPFKWKNYDSYYISKNLATSGVMEKSNGNLQAAENDLKKALEINPQNALASNNLGVIYLGKLQYDSAIHYFTKSYQSDTEHFGILMNIALAYSAERKFTEALNYGGMMFKKDSNDMQIRANLSIIHSQYGSELFTNNELEKSLAEYQAARALDTNSATAIGNIGIVYGKMGQNELAKYFYLRALAKDPNNEIFARNLRSLSGQAENFDLSLHNDSMVLQKDPPNKKVLADMRDVHVNIGMKYMNSKEYDNAFKEFSLAENIDSTSPNPIGNMGAVYFDKGNYRKAKNLFQRALLREPQNEVFIKDLHAVKTQLGEKE